MGTFHPAAGECQVAYVLDWHGSIGFGQPEGALLDRVADAGEQGVFVHRWVRYIVPRAPKWYWSFGIRCWELVMVTTITEDNPGASHVVDGLRFQIT